MTELQTLDENLWMADGPTVSFFGIPYPTRMVVARLAGGLWVWSPVALTPSLRDEVRRLGEPRWLVSPNKIHHLFLSEWLDAFDSAAAFAPPGLRERRPDIAFAGELSDALGPWGPEVEHVLMKGSVVMTEVVFFHRPSSTCLVGDLIQRHHAGVMQGWTRSAMKFDGLLGPEGSTPREWRATFVRRSGTREALQRVLAWNSKRLVIAHGECALEDGARVLRDNLRWMTRPWPL